MSEAKFWQAMKRNCKTIRFYRVENHCDPGMPDVHFITQYGTTGWVELKYIAMETHKVILRPAQTRWLAEYSRAGGCALIMVQVGIESVYVIDGQRAEQLSQGIHVDKVESPSLIDFNRPWDDMPKYLQPWPLIESTIISRSLEAYHCAVEHLAHKRQ